MSARDGATRPPYPTYLREPFTGDLPSQFGPEIGPPDFLPSGMNPSYGIYAGAYGRQVTGLDGVDMQNADHGIKDYANELDTLAVADDVQGNGLFDPPGSHGNVHPDYGIFADHESLPGYVAREKFYTASEVIDATTGGRTMFVPGGAVSIDDAQRKAYAETLLWDLPPGVNPWQPETVPNQSTVIPRNAEWGIGAVGGGMSHNEKFVIAAAAGLALGLGAAFLWPKKR